MKFITTCYELIYFPAWAGGKSFLAEVYYKHPKAYNILNDYINTWTKEGNVTQEEINDFLWFHAEDYLRDIDGFNYDEDCWEYGE